jgi:peptidyl-prolyl cis-trans isomerase A (cyclophilin A)
MAWQRSENGAVNNQRGRVAAVLARPDFLTRLLSIGTNMRTQIFSVAFILASAFSHAAPPAVVTTPAATPMAKPAVAAPVAGSATTASAAVIPAAPAPKPQVLVSTSMGDITIELEPARAPISVDNFLKYVKSGFYDGTIFHRVIPGFMIQGGGYSTSLAYKATRDAIANEANNGLKNTRGSVAMARLGDPNSASSQWFINTVDNPFLNFTSTQSPQTWGYAVFGRVIKGMDIVDKIRNVKTDNNTPDFADKPVISVVMQKVTVITPAVLPAVTPAPAAVLTPAPAAVPAKK